MTADDPRPAGEALGPTDLRAYCHQCHHAWTAHDDGTDDGDHCRVCECDGYVPDFTDEELADLQDDLDELERTDPDVAAAAASYDRMVEKVTGRTLPARPAASGGATDGERDDADAAAARLFAAAHVGHSLPGWSVICPACNVSPSEAFRQGYRAARGGVVVDCGEVMCVEAAKVQRVEAHWRELNERNPGGVRASELRRALDGEQP